MTFQQILFFVFSLGTVLFGCDDDAADKDKNGEDAEQETDNGDAELGGNQCAFETGNYPNRFLDIGYTEKEVEDKIAAAWEQLFHGDEENETVYFEAGENDNGPLAYIKDIDSNDVRSEGMSYGMMFAVQLDHKAAFDALWNWAKTYMWHGDEDHPFYEYFSWSLDTEGNPRDEAPAPDGEEYFATALYFADGRWGSGDGIYAYKDEADRLVSAMKNRESITGTYSTTWGGTTTGTGAPIFNPTYKMVRFSPNAGYFETTQGDHTDPSYHLPAFYTLWAEWGPEADSAFWLDAAEASRDFFQAAADPETALTPNWAHFDGAPVASAWNPNTATFGADACRTVMNWSMDWAWFCADEREQALTGKLQAFFDLQGYNYYALYELDGTPLEPIEDNYFSPSVVAMNATSALSATDDTYSLDMIEYLWNLRVPDGQYRYYDGMLYLFGLLHVSGNFRIYPPQSDAT